MGWARVTTLSEAPPPPSHPTDLAPKVFWQTISSILNGLLMKGQQVGEEGEGMCCIPKYQREFGICERLFYAF